MIMDGRLEAIGKRCAYAALASGFAVRRRLRAIGRRNVLTILNLHRVSNADGSGYVPLDPLLFGQLLDFVARHFSVTTFDRISEPSPKPKLILSFDDGYKDFVEVAAPALRARRMRVNQNIIPECIEEQRPPLNVMAQDFVGRAPPALTQKLDIPGFRDFSANNLARRLSFFIKHRPHAEQERLAEILVPQFYGWDAFAPTPMMNRDEVRQMALEHELGAHSYSHASMAFESNAYLENDLRRCKDYFAEVVGTPMRIYAFPNGSYREEQIEIVAGSGVQHILLVGEDFASPDSPHTRFTFHAHSSSEVKFRALGGLRPVRTPHSPGSGSRLAPSQTVLKSLRIS